MKNTILYYYNLDPNDIHQQNDIYFFKVNNVRFFMYPLLRSNEELSSLYKIDLELSNRNVPVHKIILNKDNNIITIVDNKPYILIRSFVKKNDYINMEDLFDLAKKTIIIKEDINLDKTNWPFLWEKKNDYLEYQISQFGIKFPVICECFSYYIGLAENAILYARNTMAELKPDKSDRVVISHRRINHKSTLFDLYNPLEFVIDYEVRDVAEYIKFKFFYNKKNLWEEIKFYIDSANLSNFGVRMLFARLLYPTYFFDLYDEIIDSESGNEEKIVLINKKQEEYEDFLSDIYHFLSLKYYIPPIEWLTKR